MSPGRSPPAGGFGDREGAEPGRAVSSIPGTLHSLTTEHLLWLPRAGGLPCPQSLIPLALSRVLIPPCPSVSLRGAPEGRFLPFAGLLCPGCVHGRLHPASLALLVLEAPLLPAAHPPASRLEAAQCPRPGKRRNLIPTLSPKALDFNLGQGVTGLVPVWSQGVLHPVLRPGWFQGPFHGTPSLRGADSSGCGAQSFPTAPLRVLSCLFCFVCFYGEAGGEARTRRNGRT